MPAIPINPLNTLVPVIETETLVLRDAQSAYPSPSRWLGPGGARLSPYDVIMINGLTMPLAGQPRSGTRLEIDKHKGRGHDWARLISKGYEAFPTHFILLLMEDTISGMNWLDQYDRYIRDVLMPSDLDLRNAVRVYHPMLSGDRITQLVVEERSTPYHAGKQMWHVDVRGYDIRFAQAPKNVTKKVPTSGGLRSNGNQIDVELARSVTDEALNPFSPNPAFNPNQSRGTNPGIADFSNPDAQSLPDTTATQSSLPQTQSVAPSADQNNQSFTPSDALQSVP